MALIYITGPTGSGKSAVCEELGKLGYETHDTDKDGVRHWIDVKTGEPIKSFSKDEVYDKQWMNDHKLGLSKTWLEELKSKSLNKLIFVCGTSPIDHANSGVFSTIIVLAIDEQTLIQRVRDRTNNDYGKKTHQLNNAVRWRQLTIDRYKQIGAYEIDGTLPIDGIIKKILAVSK